MAEINKKALNWPIVDYVDGRKVFNDCSGDTNTLNKGLSVNSQISKKYGGKRIMKAIFKNTKDHKKHFTATGYTVNKNRTKMLLIHHKGLNKWLPPGGHIEDNEVPHEAAIREVYEETGVMAIPIKDDENDLALKGIKEAQIPRPYALMYQIIPKSKKDVEHIHLDMVFALEADDSDKITAQYKEVHDVRWVTRKSLIDEYDTFDSVRSFARNMLK